MHIVQFEAMHSIKDAELISVINRPPCNIESPDFDISDKNLIIIDTESNNPSKWVNCRALWLGIHWVIGLSLPVGGHDDCEKVIIRLRAVPAKKKYRHQERSILREIFGFKIYKTLIKKDTTKHSRKRK